MSDSAGWFAADEVSQPQECYMYDRGTAQRQVQNQEDDAPQVSGRVYRIRKEGFP